MKKSGENQLKKLLQFVASLTVLTVLVFSPLNDAFTAHAEIISEIGEETESAVISVWSDRLSQEQLADVTDGDEYTYYKTSVDRRFQFRTSKPVKGLYFLFEKPCRWTLTLPDGSVKQGGENGYLHEYFALEKEITGFAIDLPAGGCLTDVYAFTDGVLPDWVQIWQPPCKRADLMIMSTHADDEHLWFGGAMPYYAGELGYQVQVVYLTHHYKETYRGHELLNGLWKVGIRNYPVITEKFLDDKETKRSFNAAASYFGYDRVMEFQVEMLRQFSPRVVLGQDFNGEYGHGAHKLNSRTLLEALKIYQDPAVYPESAEKYGIHPVQKCYLHLWGENQITVQWSDKILAHFGGRSALEMAKEGYSCHKSQQKWSFRVKEYGKYDCRQFGLVYTTVGSDTPGRNDMFENVDWSDGEEEEPENAESAVSSEAEAEVPSEESSPEEGEALSKKKTGIEICGKEILYNDVVFGVLAAVLSFAAVIAVIWLKGRQ